MMRGLTIRWRLTLWYGGVLAAVLALFGTTVYLVMRHQMFERVDSGLSEELADVLGEVRRATDREGMLHWLNRRFGGHEGFDFQITDDRGERVFANPRLSDGRLPVPGPTTSGEPLYRAGVLQGRELYRIVSTETEGPDGPLTVQVARSLEATDHELSELLAVLLGVGPLVVGLALAGGYFLAGRALAPVDRMTIAANSIDARRLSHRLDVVNEHDELGRLARTLNGMLDRIEQSFREMQRFTADASHELRTPLAVIRAEAEVALGKPMPESEKQDLLGSILEECQRLTSITDQLLTLAREDAGIAQSPREAVDLSRLVTEVTETMRPLADGKQQRLNTVVNGSSIVQGDPVRLRHVVYNLLDNAIKYTAEGGNVLVNVAPANQCVRITVEDTGVGIPAEHLPHVFERFYRADKSRSRIVGGTGLGLSIVQSIVTAHGGTVEVSSTLNEGTRFVVEFPTNGQTE
jgi:heavy metal sensor kinase